MLIPACQTFPSKIQNYRRSLFIFKLFYQTMLIGTRVYRSKEFTLDINIVIVSNKKSRQALILVNKECKLVHTG